MANQSELMGIIERLRVAFPAYTPTNPGCMLDLYAQKLEGYHIDDIRRGAEYIIEHNRFFPSVKELMDATKAAHYEPINQVATITRDKRWIINHEIYEPTEEDYKEWQNNYKNYKAEYLEVSI